MASITIKNKLRLTWFDNQLTSLTEGLRDFEYTMLLYTLFWNSRRIKKNM